MTQEETKIIIPEVEKAIEEWFTLNWDSYVKSQERENSIDLPF